MVMVVTLPGVTVVVLGAVMVWLPGNVPVLPAKLVSPLYAAVIACGLPPTSRLLVVNVAMPTEFPSPPGRGVGVRVAVPIDKPPSSKMTVPVGTSDRLPPLPSP